VVIRVRISYGLQKDPLHIGQIAGVFILSSWRKCQRVHRKMLMLLDAPGLA
jgi:hypothetical protein